MAENKTLQCLPEVRAAVATLSPEDRKLLDAVQASPFRLTEPQQFQEFSANIDYFVFEPNIHDLNDLGWRYIAQHMDMLLPPELLDAIDPVPFGKYAMKEEQGHFTEHGYSSVISEIQDIWAKHEINEIYGPTTERSAYESRVQRIIQNIISESPIMLSRDALGISGNLNAKKIKEICDRHRIRYRLETRGESLERVKLERNNLAHGDVSFSDCARNLSLGDLETIKDEVFLFIDGILKGMKDYYDGKQYRQS